jgi:O-antigen/teichoic acid export membrane protein
MTDPMTRDLGRGLSVSADRKPLALHQATRNLLSGYVLIGASAALLLVLTPVFIKRLGPVLYGYWCVLNSVVGYLGVFEFGLSTATTRFTADALARQDWDARARVLSQIIVLYCGASALVLAVGAVLSGLLPPWFRVTGGEAQGSAIAVFVVCVGLVLTLFSNFFGALAFGHERQDVPNLIGVAAGLAQGLLGYWLLTRGFAVVALATATVVAAALGLALRFGYAVTRFGPLGISLRRLADSGWGGLLRFGGSLFLTSVGGQIILNSASIIVGRVVGLKQAATYAIAYQLVMASSLLAQRISDVFFPVMVGSHARSDFTRLRQVFVESAVLAAALYMAFAVVLAAFGEALIVAWVGSSNFVGRPAMWALLGFGFLQTHMHSHGLLLVAVGRMRPLVWWNLAEAALNLACGLVLVVPLGAAGVAVAGSAAILLSSRIFLPSHTAQILRTRRSKLTSEMVLRTVGPALPFVAAAPGLRSLTLTWRPAAVLAAGVAFALGYLACVWVSLGRERRAQYRDAVADLIRPGERITRPSISRVDPSGQR